MFRITETVKHLIIINVIMLIGSMTIGGGILFEELFAEYFPENPLFKFWQIITHMFMHSGWEHLFGNMFLLLIFGSWLEESIGKTKFIFLYISAGLGATALPLIIDYTNYLSLEVSLLENGFSKIEIKQMLSENIIIPTVDELQRIKLQKMFNIFHKSSRGASGAVMGVMAAIGYLFPNREIVLLFPPIPLKIKYLVVGMIGADFISAVLIGTSLIGSDGTGYTAHVGGAFIGFIIMWYWKKNQFKKNRWDL